MKYRDCDMEFIAMHGGIEQKLGWNKKV
ncbi:hypothetical protein NC653_022475 [Populus alba x Populus x berolinensis]|uniref:Uncharacterized protein n=1 Tax=Populus alba x Populus x berolinensis TaxID=444605 RepID=A0AAD6Q9R6_9ROSI|nr:hypothetical protein NC653_022475 [Populus alba x Populus x berolinensis]